VISVLWSVVGAIVLLLILRLFRSGSTGAGETPLVGLASSGEPWNEPRASSKPARQLVLSSLAEQAPGGPEHIVDRIAVAIAVELAKHAGGLRMLGEDLAEAAQRPFAADVLDDLAQRAAVDAGSGSRGRDRVAGLRMSRTESGYRFFGEPGIKPDLARKIGDIDVAAKLAEDSIENAHIASDRFGALFNFGDEPVRRYPLWRRPAHSS
jgi:hypothetical protein